MTIEANKVVKLTYELYVGNEKEIMEVAGEDSPMVFIHGLSGLPEAFENKLLGMKAGETFDFSLTSDEAYGDIDEEAIIDFPKENFGIEDGEIPEGMLEIGNFIPFKDDNEQQLTGRIIKVEDESVWLDFNHPLAGKLLHFEGKILAVREATASEMEHGHVHGEGGVIH
jgi:FKBP-type peptidyl-prolyl cis-trans isomerase SlyD